MYHLTSFVFIAAFAVQNIMIPSLEQRVSPQTTHSCRVAEPGMDPRNNFQSHHHYCGVNGDYWVPSAGVRHLNHYQRRIKEAMPSSASSPSLTQPRPEEHWHHMPSYRTKPRVEGRHQKHETRGTGKQLLKTE